MGQKLDTLEDYNIHFNNPNVFIDEINKLSDKEHYLKTFRKLLNSVYVEQMVRKEFVKLGYEYVIFLEGTTYTAGVYHHETIASKADEDPNLLVFRVEDFYKMIIN